MVCLWSTIRLKFTFLSWSCVRTVILTMWLAATSAKQILLVSSSLIHEAVLWCYLKSYFVPSRTKTGASLVGTNGTVTFGACDVWEEAEGAAHSLDKRKLWGDLIAPVRRLLRSQSGYYGVTRKKTTDNSHKLKQDRFQLSIMKLFSAPGQLDIWTGLIGAGESSSLQVLNTWLDKPWSAWSEFSVDPALSGWTRNLLSSSSCSDSVCNAGSCG